jgi:hypothetical protein
MSEEPNFVIAETRLIDNTDVAYWLPIRAFPKVKLGDSFLVTYLGNEGFDVLPVRKAESVMEVFNTVDESDMVTWRGLRSREDLWEIIPVTHTEGDDHNGDNS